MRLKVNKSKNSVNYYIITDTKTKEGKRSTKVFKKLGNEQEILKISNGTSPLEWAKKQVEELNKQEQENNLKIILEKSPSKVIPKNTQNLFNIGYIFLEKLYYELEIDKICKQISDKYKFEYDLNSILSRLLYGRIIYPSSKLATYNLSKNFLEQPNFELQHIY